MPQTEDVEQPAVDQEAGYDPAVLDTSDPTEKPLEDSYNYDDVTAEGAPEPDVESDEKGKDEVAGEESAEEKDKETSEPVEDDSFDAELLGHARQMGFDETEARAFGTADNLAKALTSMLDVMEAVPQPTPQPVEGAKDKAPPELKLDLVNDLLKGEDIDPELAKSINGLFTKMNDHYANQMDQVQKAVGHLIMTADQTQKTSQADSARAYEQRFDTFIENLPAEYVDDVGKGPTASMGPGEKVLRTRLKIDEKARVLRVGYEGQRNGSMPSEKQLLEEAVQLVLGNKAKTAARNELSAKMNKRSSQTIGKATQRVEKPIDREDQAAASWDAYRKKAGLD